MEKKREERRHLLHCNIAGFTYWDGCIAFNELEIGTKLELIREKDNRYDPNAVAIYYNNLKLGYIPSSENEIICNFLDMGYKGAFETRVCCLGKEAHPEKQVHINVYIKERETNKSE